MKAPPRLFDDTTAPARLRSDLARVSNASHPYDPVDGLAQLQANLRAFDAHGGGSEALDPAGSVSTVGTAVKAGWAVKTVVAAVVGVSSWAAWTAWPAGSPQPSLSQPPTAAVLSPHAAPSVAPPPAPSIASPPAPSIAPPPAPALSAETERPRAAVAPVSSHARSLSPQRRPVHREIEQLAQVKARMATDPAAAYRIARQSAREFPSGVLREEREGLSALALWQMGRHADARAVAEQFLSRYPRSPLRARIEQLVDPQR